MHERTVTQAGAPIADDIMDEPKHRVGDRVELKNHLRTFCTAEPPMQIVQIAEPFPAALSTKTLLDPSQAAAEAKIGVVMAPHCSTERIVLVFGILSAKCFCLRGFDGQQNTACT